MFFLLQIYKNLRYFTNNQCIITNINSSNSRYFIKESLYLHLIKTINTMKKFIYALSAIVLSFSLISCDKDTSGIEPFDASLLIGKWMLQGQLDGYYNPETGEIQDGEYDDVTDLEVFVTFTEDGRCISEVNETEYNDYVLVEGDYEYSQESRTLTTTANGITTTYDVNELTADRLVMTIYDEWSFGTQTTYVRISE